jgi:hypothetical protein
MAGIASVLITSPTTAFSQSSVSPAADWNGNYGFSSASDRNLRLLQADMIKKGETDYYDGLGKTNYNVITNNSVSTTNNVDNRSTSNIGQQTTAIGSVNSSTTNIDVRDSTNIAVDTSSTSQSDGCQDASVHLENDGPSPGGFTCR